MDPSFQRGDRLAQVVDTIDVDRAVALEVIREQDVRRPVGQLDHRHARAHALDRERELAAKHVGEELRVRGDVIGRGVQIVELQKRVQDFAIPKKQPRCSPSFIER